MSKTKCFIFDIDNTLANNSHRQHHVRTTPKNWDKYNELMPYDTTIKPVVHVYDALVAFGETIILCTGRQEKDRDKTLLWLCNYGIEPNFLYMRATNDFRYDTIVKEEMVKKIQERFEIVAAFDDRPKVVRMLRSNGIFVFNCQQNDEEF